MTSTAHDERCHMLIGKDRDLKFIYYAEYLFFRYLCNSCLIGYTAVYNVND